jgi:hypothetical protein
VKRPDKLSIAALLEEMDVERTPKLSSIDQERIAPAGNDMKAASCNIKV